MKKVLFGIITLTLILTACSQNSANNDTKEKETAENTVSFKEDHIAAKFTTEEIVKKCPVGTSFNDYTTEILRHVTVAETYNLSNKNVFEVLIARDGFVGVESNRNEIVNIQTFYTFQDVTDYVEKNR